MQVVGVGIDLVEIGPFARKLERQSFRDQVFTAAEQAAVAVRTNPAQAFAAKFAAKEAVMKVLGAGIRQSVWFTTIEILDEESGAATVNLVRAAEACAGSLGIATWHISTSHRQRFASATAVALARGR